MGVKKLDSLVNREVCVLRHGVLLYTAVTSSSALSGPVVTKHDASPRYVEYL
jgi:hypothetical protein